MSQRHDARRLERAPESCRAARRRDRLPVAVRARWQHQRMQPQSKRPRVGTNENAACRADRVDDIGHQSGSRRAQPVRITLTRRSDASRSDIETRAQQCCHAPSRMIRPEMQGRSRLCRPPQAGITGRACASGQGPSASQAGSAPRRNSERPLDSPAAGPTSRDTAQATCCRPCAGDASAT